jgi:hypothetical protein
MVVKDFGFYTPIYINIQTNFLFSGLLALLIKFYLAGCSGCTSITVVIAVRFPANA